MTKYDLLIDGICTELYNLWVSGCDGESWNDDMAKCTAHHILELVEQYQSQQKTMRWRASD